ncbi:MAG TPA: type II secretion system protein GspM [Methylomirabilota bacterium]|nr:type II secretion system protein GspM [Methylomirabilota bacterium]
MFSTPWLSRLAALLLLAAVIAALDVFVVEPLTAAYARTDQAIEEARELLARYDRLGAARDDLAGGTDALAAAQLQGRLKTLVESSGGTIGSMQTLPTVSEQDLKRVAIRLEMSAPLLPLLRVLQGLETGVPLLFVDNMDVQSRLIQLGGTDDAQQEPVLAVGFDVYGYLPPAAPAAQAQPATAPATAPQ